MNYQDRAMARNQWLHDNSTPDDDFDLWDSEDEDDDLHEVDPFEDDTIDWDSDEAYA